jgi:uncharacterized cupredoxin-like copper-binding protein
MYRRFMLLGLALAAIVLTVGGYAVAQDSTSEPDAAGTPADLLCATPVSETEGTPATVATAPETAATPGGSEPGTPVGLFPCGTPGASTPAVDAGGTNATEAMVVSVEMVDIAFVPTTLTIPANTDVTFHFVNNGAAVHNFKIDDPEVFSGDLSGGQSIDLTVNLPAGTYKFYCTIPGHEAAGMVGELTVQ